MAVLRGSHAMRRGSQAVIRINDRVWIEDGEIHETFMRSSGAGGQNIQKVETAVQIKFDVLKSQRLPPYAHDNLKRLAGRRLSGSGVITLSAQRFRTQERNRADALDRLVALLREAVEPPPPNRRATRPTFGSVKRRLADKTARSKTKSARRPTTPDTP